MNDKFKKFGNSITSLISGIDLNRKQTRELVSEILNSEQSDIHQEAFLAAITAKGPCPDEIAGGNDPEIEALRLLKVFTSKEKKTLRDHMP